MVQPHRSRNRRRRAGSVWYAVVATLVVVLWIGVLSCAAADESTTPAAQSDTADTFNTQALSPQQAYERAVYLLRRTLVNQPKISTSKPQPPPQPTSKKDRTGSSSTGKQPKRLQGASLYWQLIREWLPFAGIFRDLIRLRDLLLTFNPFPLDFDGAVGGAGVGGQAAGSARIPSTVTGGGLGWEGAGLLTPSDAFAVGKDPVEEEQARKYPGARPEALWPEWDGGDSAYFGPFLSTTHDEADSKDDAKTSGSVNSAKYEGDNNSTSVWDKIPGTSLRKRKEAEQRKAADRRREEAIALLTWAAGWGDAEAITDASKLMAESSHVDWPAEARQASSTSSANSEAYILDFLASQGNEMPAMISRPNADALWTLAMHSFWGTHGAVPQPARAKACFERLASLNGNASAHNYLGWIEGGAWGEEGWRMLGVNDEKQLAVVAATDDDAERQAKALMHYTAAARAGDSLAQMTLGYRHHAGVGVPQSCGATLLWYELAAKDALARFQSGPPGGLHMPYTHLRLSDLSGGVYGPGASAASTGMAKHRPAIQAMLNSLPSDGSSGGRRLEDLLEFFTYHAQRGEPGYALTLARIYYGGSVLGAGESAARVQRDYKKAREYLLRITRDVWPVDAMAVNRGGPTDPAAGKTGGRSSVGAEDVKLKVEDAHASQAATAAGLLGRIWLRGEGVPSSYARAWVWFQRGAEQGDTESFNGLGVMHQLGLGVPVNMKKAVEYFEMAASAGVHSSVDGCMNLGKIHFLLQEYTQAYKYFDLAMRLGSSFEAYYYLAMINVRAGNYRVDPHDPTAYLVDVPGTASHVRCQSAVSAFKYAVERADWKDPTFTRAERAWSKGLRGRALLGWSIAGERGYEAAQNNVAWILDRDKKRLQFASVDAPPASNVTDRLALIHWIRSAAQENVDALVKMGDYYYYGLGGGAGFVEPQHESKSSSTYAVDDDKSSSDTTPPPPPPTSSSAAMVASVSYDKAVACYSAAADRQTSALAYWNMGYMYEHGLGVPRKDYNLAKRYYDMALEVNKEAYLPVRLSIIKLFIMACWDAVTKKDATALNLLNGFVFGPSGRGRFFGGGGGTVIFDNGDVPYTEAEELRIQREREEMGAAGGGGGDVEGVDAIDLGDPNLPETYAAGLAADRRHANAENGGGGIGMRFGSTDNLDSTIEGLLIVFGLAALAMLVYVRQGVQLRLERQRRDEAAAADANRTGTTATDEQQQQQRPAGPPQVDPNQPFGWPLQDGNAYAGL